MWLASSQIVRWALLDVRWLATFVSPLTSLLAHSLTRGSAHKLGGTVGDIESMPFVEAFRQFQFRIPRKDFFLVHVSLVRRVPWVALRGVGSHVILARCRARVRRARPRPSPHSTACATSVARASVPTWSVGGLGVPFCADVDLFVHAPFFLFLFPAASSCAAARTR